jgi:hypothetical protein
MKLGEALSKRALQAQQLNDLRGRITANALVQEGTEAQEDPGSLIAEYTGLSQEHGALVRRINLTNTHERVSNGNGSGELLVDLLTRREHLRRVKNTLEAVATAAVPGRDVYRYMRTELQYVAKIDVPSAHREIGDVTENIRALDARIQQANWEIDLVE